MADADPGLEPLSEREARLWLARRLGVSSLADGKKRVTLLDRHYRTAIGEGQSFEEAVRAALKAARLK